MDRLQVLALVSTLVTGFMGALEHGSWPTTLSLSRKVRTLIVSLLGIVAGALDATVAGGTFGQALLTTLATSLPTLILVFLNAAGAKTVGEIGEPPPKDPDAKKDEAVRAEKMAVKKASVFPPKGPGAVAMVARGLVLSCALVAAGCVPGKGPNIPAIVDVLEDVVSLVTDAQGVLAGLHSTEQAFFLRHPDPEAQAKAESAFAFAELMLNAGQRTTKGAANLGRGEITAAFANFVVAFSDLQALLMQLHVLPANAKALIAAGHKSIPPEPMLVSRAK